jgi:hypothetical protein
LCASLDFGTAKSRYWPIATSRGSAANGRFWGIVLQKSKVAALQIFRANPKREKIADSYNLNRATEVAYEFNVWR